MTGSARFRARMDLPARWGRDAYRQGLVDGFADEVDVDAVLAESERMINAHLSRYMGHRGLRYDMRSCAVDGTDLSGLDERDVDALLSGFAPNPRELEQLEQEHRYYWADECPPHTALGHLRIKRVDANTWLTEHVSAALRSQLSLAASWAAGSIGHPQAWLDGFSTGPRSELDLNAAVNVTDAAPIANRLGRLLAPALTRGDAALTAAAHDLRDRGIDVDWTAVSAFLATTAGVRNGFAVTPAVAVSVAAPAATAPVLDLGGLS